MHYSDSNIREKTLLDNPGRLTELINKSGAKSADYQNLETAEEFSDKCVEASKNWAPVAKKLWTNSGCFGNCRNCSENK